MPELPELEVFSRNLQKRVAGRSVQKVELWRVSARRRNFSDEEITEALVKSALSEVRREGKGMRLVFSNKRELGVHLMLTGEFNIASDPKAIDSPRLGLELEGGEWLVVSDPQGFTTFILDPEPEKAPDTLSNEFDLEYLRSSLKKSKAKPIKGFLVDQDILRGIGNTFADEILWACRIAPQSLCDRLPEEKIGDLHRAIGSVLKDAITLIKHNARDAINGDVRDFLSIHKRKKCPLGHPVKSEMVASKKSYYCEEQVVYR